MFQEENNAQGVRQLDEIEVDFNAMYEAGKIQQARPEIVDFCAVPMGLFFSLEFWRSWPGIYFSGRGEKSAFHPAKSRSFLHFSVFRNILY